MPPEPPEDIDLSHFEPEAPATQPAPRPIVDLDAGQGFGEITIALKAPFKLAGTEYSAFTMRVPTGGEVSAALAGKDPGGEIEALTESLCNLPAGALKRIYSADRTKAITTLGELLAGVLPSGT